MEAVSKLIYLGDRVSTGGGCERVILPEQDVDGLNIVNMESYCLERGFYKTDRGCLFEL